MRRIKVTGRFFVFLAMLLVGLFFIVREFWALDSSEAIVTKANATYDISMDAVVIRDESVTDYEGEGRIEFLVPEGATVKSGDEIADLYTASHITKAFTELEGVRSTIRTYYQKVLSGIKDPELDRLETNVQAQAYEMKRLVRNHQLGSLVNVERLLRKTMDERYQHLSANRREDPKLSAYFDQERNLVSSIDSWKTTKKADKDGVVSFYLDGYERDLLPDTMSEITPEMLRTVLAQKPLRAQTPNVRMTKDVYKITNIDKWHVMLISNNETWNPVAGQLFQMQMEGVGGFAFVGTVTEVQKSQGDIVALVEVETSIGPLLNRRSGSVNISTHLTGFAVPRNAIAYRDGQAGVWLSDAAGGTFVPVEVLTTDEASALVDPLTEGSLKLGHKVLLK